MTFNSSHIQFVPVADVIGSNYHATNGMNGTVGQIYQIEVDDYSGAGGPYTLKIVP